MNPRELLKSFIDRTDRVLQLVEGFVPEAAWLADAETLTYLHSCISTKRHRVRVPETPMHLDALLAGEPFTAELELRDARCRAIAAGQPNLVGRGAAPQGRGQPDTAAAIWSWRTS